MSSVTGTLVELLNTYRLRTGGDPALLRMGRDAYLQLVAENSDYLREKVKPNRAPSFAGIDIEIHP